MHDPSLLLPPSVDPTIMEQFCKLCHPGPTPADMPLCWKEPMSHLWNIAVIQLLTTKFKRNVKSLKTDRNLPAHREDGEDFVMKSIQNKLDRWRAELMSGFLCVDRHPHLTQAELAEQVTQKKWKKLATSRRNERKRNVLSFK